jgi:hypothetical protein
MMRTSPERGLGGGSLLTRLGALTIVAIAIAGGGCKKSTQDNGLGPESFASPESAGKAVYLAVNAGDTNALLAIFGQDARDLLFTGDSAQDMLAFRDFAVDYEMMHRWAKLENGALVLDVGMENYPFPFPIVKQAEGQWLFSNVEARKEVLARKIGQNELAVMDVLNAMVEAQREYSSDMHDGKPRQYAQRFVSHAGKHDGLYWQAVEEQTKSPLGPLAALANATGFQQAAERPEPFHGYFFRMVAQQGAHAQGGAKKYVVDGLMTGGFGFVAYPGAYSRSGVMTFQVNQDGIIYQKDLGSGTPEAANALDSFDPDENWAVAQ